MILLTSFSRSLSKVLEQKLVGADGKDPMSIQKDFFAPLGSRVTVISDYKRPLKEDSQRVLVAVALRDAPAFQRTLKRFFEVTQAAPKVREFQGTTIYDLDLTSQPDANAAAGAVLLAFLHPGGRQEYVIRDYRYDPAREGASGRAPRL